ncbi:MAG: MFS transporter [Pseudomonadota bacterium]
MEMRAPVLPLLMVVAGISVLSLNMFLPSLAFIARDFDVSYATASWAVSGYLAMTAALQLILGPLSDRIGRRPVVLFSLGTFAVLSAVCALATRFDVFIVARLLQGFVIAGSTMGLAALRDTAEPEAAARQISWVAMGMAVGPMIGPMIGGVLDETFGWRAIFWVLSGGGALCFVFALFGWRETNFRRSASFGAQFRAYPALVSSPFFWAYAGAIITGVGCFYVFITGAPLVADKVLDISTAELGLAIGIITMGFFVGNGVSGRIAERVGIPGMVLAGRSIQLGAVVANLILLGFGIFEPISFFGLMAFVGFGNGISSPSANAGVMSVNPALAGSAAGLAGALVLAFGAVFTAVSAQLLELGPPALMLLLSMAVLAGLGLVAGISGYRLSRAARI